MGVRWHEDLIWQTKELLKWDWSLCIYAGVERGVKDLIFFFLLVLFVGWQYMDVALATVLGGTEGEMFWWASYFYSKYWRDH